MGEATAAIDIDRGPDTVWAAIGDFGGIGDWMPGIESCRVEGENRILAMMGMEITEHLVSKDDAERVLVYSIVDGVPVERHQGTITVTASQDGSHVTWHVDAAPDDMAQMMGGLYQQALEALKKHVEG
ncbi:MAG: SRPBCC family protein [Actinomycetota bacterium]|jgi:carbon monoxide dehydrogenase subunit G|nr:SRPBCC family protein [Actinomycetota bacterium]